MVQTSVIDDVNTGTSSNNYNLVNFDSYLLSGVLNKETSLSLMVWLKNVDVKEFHQIAVYIRNNLQF